MTSDDVVKRAMPLLDEIYQLPGRLDLWPEFISNLRKVFDATTAVCSYGGPEGVGAFASVGDGQAIQSFTEHYGLRCPWNYSWFASAPEGSVGTDAVMLPTDQLQESEFYNDWQLPHAHRHLLVGVVRKKGIAMRSGLAFWRPPRAAFNNAESAVMQLLVPHAQQVLWLHERLGTLRCQLNSARDAFDTLSYAVIVLDNRGQVLAANAEATRIIAARDGLNVDRRTLRASDPQVTSSLRKAVLAVLEASPGDYRGAGDSFACPRPSMKRPYVVRVASLGTARYDLLQSSAAAVVFVTDPERRVKPAAVVLHRLYGLTARESQLASILGAGQSVDSAAAILRMTRETARTHLKSIFKKTGVKRQTALVRLMLTTMPDRNSDISGRS